jgi:hypothetical protein
MKKLSLLIIAIAFIGLSASAQSGYFKRASDSKTTDTLTNAATSNLQLPITGYQNVVSVQALVTKLTGTTAGVVRLYGSLDGTNYVRANPTDSLTLANAAGIQTKIFIIKDNPYAFYRVGTIGTGTQTTKVQAYAVWRKQ